MGVFSMWNNHRARQSGKYAKSMARQPYVAPMPVQAPMYTDATWQTAFQRGRQAGYLEGWQEGQKDLVIAIKTGRLTWDQAVRRLT